MPATLRGWLEGAGARDRVVPHRPRLRLAALLVVLASLTRPVHAQRPTPLLAPDVVAVAASGGIARDAIARDAVARDSVADYDALHRYVVAQHETPLDAVRRAVLSHPVVLLGDVHPALEPKQLLLALLADSLVATRLDAVAFEVPASAQRWIAAYLQSSPEDPSLLFRESGTLRTVWGGSDEWLAIFHRLWELQRDPRRDRALEVVAMDLPGWPDRATSARAAVSMYADRDSAMASNLLDAIAACDGCAARGGARVLAFVGGYHVLRGLEADLSIGPNNGRVIWLATRLERRGVHPFTVLTDGLPRAVALGGATVHGATRLYDVLAQGGWPAAPYAVETSGAFDAVARAIREPDDPTDIAFTLRPRRYRLRDAVDLFIYWGPTTQLGANAAPRALGR